MPNDEEVIQRAGSLRAMTGFTQQEFTALLPHVEHAFLAYMAERTIDGHPRTSRRYSAYETSPVPTMADKLLFIFLCETEPDPSSARATLWDIPVACEQVDSSPPCRVESDARTPRVASGPDS
jgi:hypothetical protein